MVAFKVAQACTLFTYEIRAAVKRLQSPDTQLAGSFAGQAQMTVLELG
jgi:hypothetical protein